jgi:predicted Zn finger-like uncharacterized protein
MSAVNDEELRYTFSCPGCNGSFSISLSKIPPVQARFSCPKCSKAMDFPSRDEARVYVQLQSGGDLSSEPAAEPPPVRSPEPPPPVVTPPAARREAPAPAPAPAARAAAPDAMDGTQAGKTYRLEKKGYDTDDFDRRAMRNLIRSAAVNENDMVSVAGAPAVRSDTVPELKSLFELRKTARATPPPVCPKHTERLAHYQCADTGRPLCDECFEEKKFGGTSVLVCSHCGGTASELHAAPGDSIK